MGSPFQLGKGLLIRGVCGVFQGRTEHKLNNSGFKSALELIVGTDSLLNVILN